MAGRWKDSGRSIKTGPGIREPLQEKEYKIFNTKLLDPSWAFEGFCGGQGP